ncbi:MAG: hypothetical protein AB8F94_07845 [Saprospiraceae bacterium]
MEKNKDQKLIAKCLLEIEERLGWGNSTDWHNDVFIELSGAIQEHTKILLSPTTLKRVWGKVNYQSSPSINTLNTLAQFAGYLNWRDFKNKSEIEPIHPKLPKGKALGYLTILFISLAFFLLATRSNHQKKEGFDFSKMEFSSRPITKGLPNSVVFDFDLKEVKSDSVYIQQFWDRTKTIKLKPNQTQATGQYYFPGYFRAKLLVDGDIKQEHDLFIKSEGWLGTIDYDPVPKYFEEKRVLKNNLVLPKNALEEIASSEQPLVSTFHFVDDLGEISGDNFLLETSFRNIYHDKWAVCSSTRLVILGTEGAMIIPFSIPGCVSEIGVMLNDVYLSGKENDLSMFGTDLSQFKNIEVHVENKNVTVSINDKNIYTGQYSDPIGNIVGIRYRFLGAGEVDFLKLRNLASEEFIINEDF